MAAHTYEITVTWTGDRGEGTSSIKGYDRSHTISADGPPDIEGTADPTFLGDLARWNPEQLFVAALSQCHMLWYLGLCARAGVVVSEYVDRPAGTCVTAPDGSGRFTEVVLRPRITVAAEDQVERATALHEKANRMCFVAQSVTCDIRHEPEIKVR